MRSFRAGKVLAIAYAGCLPFDGVSLPGGRSLTFYLGVALLLSLVAYSVNARVKGPYIAGPVDLAPAFAFVVLSIASVLWSPVPELTLGYSLTLTMSIASAFALAAFLPYVGPSAYRAYVIGAAALSIIMLFSPPDEYGRRSVTGDANMVSAYLVLAVAMVLSRAPHGDASPRLQRSFAVLGVVCAAGVIATASRAGLVGLLGVLLIALVTEKRTLVMRAAIGVAVTFGTLVMFGIGELAVVPSRLTQVGQEILAGTLNQRTIIWEVVLRQEATFLGIGSGATPWVTIREMGRPSVSHNVFLGVWLELGWLGILVLSIALFHYGNRARTSSNRRLLILAAPGLLAAGMTLSLEASRYLWFIAVLALPVLSQPRDAKANA